MADEGHITCSLKSVPFIKKYAKIKKKLNVILGTGNVQYL